MSRRERPNVVSGGRSIAGMSGGVESGRKARNTKTLEKDERHTFENRCVRFSPQWAGGGLTYTERRNGMCQSGAVKAKRVRSVTTPGCGALIGEISGGSRRGQRGTCELGEEETRDE